MNAQDRVELARLRQQEAEETQREFDKEMAPLLAFWKRIQAKTGWK